MTVQTPPPGHDLDWVSKVPKVTAIFWLIKILGTTVGETGADALSMTLKLGYAVASLIFLAFFAVTVAVQIGRRRYHPLAYWAVVVATTTMGTTISDYLDRTVGLGYVKSSALLLICVIAILAVWRLVAGRIEFEDIASKRDEAFYWVVILVSNTLGTALGDFTATTGPGFEGGAMVFFILLALVAGTWRLTKKVPPGVFFWAAYVLTRPLGATVGDTLTKSRADGGFALDRISASVAILALMAVAVVAQRWNLHTRRQVDAPARR